MVFLLLRLLRGPCAYIASSTLMARKQSRFAHNAATTGTGLLVSRV
jgi:hypothetical protein